MITFDLDEGDRLITNLDDLTTLEFFSPYVSATDCGIPGFKNLDDSQQTLVLAASGGDVTLKDQTNDDWAGINLVQFEYYYANLDYYQSITQTLNLTLTI